MTRAKARLIHTVTSFPTIIGIFILQSYATSDDPTMFVLSYMILAPTLYLLSIEYARWIFGKAKDE